MPACDGRERMPWLSAAGDCRFIAHASIRPLVKLTAAGFPAW